LKFIEILTGFAKIIPFGIPRLIRSNEQNPFLVGKHLIEILRSFTPDLWKAIGNWERILAGMIPAIPSSFSISC
jgi:hypothetical protein